MENAVSMPPHSIGVINCNWIPSRAAHHHSVGCPDMDSSARRKVFIDGKRIRNIGIHAHCAVPGALDVKKTPDRSDVSMKDKNARLASMD